MGMFFGSSGKVAREIGCAAYEEIEDVYDRYCSENIEWYGEPTDKEDEHE